MRALTVLTCLGVWMFSTPAAAQSRCADCHFANIDASFARHISDWDRSAHSGATVGCDSCHGGNPATFEPLIAHRDIVDPVHRASPVHRLNLPVTCGKCHPGPFAAFRDSRHYELLRGGSLDAPTCSTCHGEVGAALLSPRGLEAQCAGCHGSGKKYVRTDYGPQGRLMLQGIHSARAQLKEAEELIRRVKDAPRRERLEQAAQQVRLPLVEATHAGHAFVYRRLEERLEAARTRLAALLEQLANPPNPPQ